jgi:hypothetical protein
MLLAHLKTIFSFRFYHRLAFATRGQLFGFGAYLFLLSVIVFHFFAGAYIRENLPVLLKNFPQVTFEKGVLTEPKTPVSVSVPQSDFKIVFDASLTTPPTLKEMTDSRTLMLVTGDKLYMPGSGGVQSRTLPQTLTFTASQENLEKEKDTLAGALAAVGFLTSLFAVSASREPPGCFLNCSPAPPCRAPWCLNGRFLCSGRWPLCGTCGCG